MPRRSNEFQDLVSLVQRALAPDDAVVRDSVLVEVDGDQEASEIDVLIETKIGEYRIKIAVEAKDEVRPMDSTKFEATHQRERRTPSHDRTALRGGRGHHPIS